MSGFHTNAGGIEGTFGSQLAASLTGLRPSPMARAAGLLHHVVLNNAASKQAVLQASSAGAREGSLLVRCCRQLANMLASGQQGACCAPSHSALFPLQYAGISGSNGCCPLDLPVVIQLPLTNEVVIDNQIRPYQGCCRSSHTVCVHL